MQLTPAEGRQTLWQLNEGQRYATLYQLSEQRLTLCQAKYTTCRSQDSLSRQAYTEVQTDNQRLRKSNASLSTGVVLWRSISIGLGAVVLGMGLR